MEQYIPQTLAIKVCMCNPPGPLLHASREREMLMNHCAACGKPYRWYVRYCTVCKEPFVKDFRRKEFDCVRHTKCWDCFKTSLTICACDKEHSIREDFGPLGINPRKVSQEERSNAFTFKGPFQGDK